MKNSRCLLFADDCKIYKRVASITDSLLLQNDINNLSAWCVKNKLALNINKCSVVTFTRKNRPIVYDYKIDDLALTRKSVVRDLGVIFDSGLRFTEHVNTITNEAFRALGFIMRNTIDFTNHFSIILLYNAFVRSKLEFASAVWYPSTKKQDKLIEKVQNKFLKYLYFKRYKRNPPFESYEHIRIELIMPPLKQRRDLIMLNVLFRVFNNFLDKSRLLSLFRLHVAFYSTGPWPPMCVDLPGLSPINKICKIYNHYYETVEIFGVAKRTFLESARSAIMRRVP